MAEIKMERANRIAVQVTVEGYKADFYRTHKKLATLYSEETTWQADPTLNKTAQREAFRQFAITSAEQIGIIWDPADRRSDENKRTPKYENDCQLYDDAIAMVHGDLYELAKAFPELTWDELTADGITPMTHSPKGTDLSKLGIEAGKYLKSGNWAWADVELSLTLIAKDGQQIYYSTKCQLVSGQLKKPHITKTGFMESIRESLKEAGLLVEESKESKEESKVEETPTPKVEEPKEESKPKTTKKKSPSKKKSSKKTETPAEESIPAETPAEVPTTDTTAE